MKRVQGRATDGDDDGGDGDGDAFIIIIHRRVIDSAPFSPSSSSLYRARARRRRVSSSSNPTMEFTVVESWDGKGVTWRPIYEDDSESYVAYTHMVEYAKSGRGKCGRCSEKIAKDATRIGEPLKYRGGDYGWISKWMHPGCYRIEGKTHEELREEVYGLDNLKEADVEALLRAVTNPEKPEIEKDELDVESAEFLCRPVIAPMEAPGTLTRPLLSFQKEGLAWMCGNEEDENLRGGVLADEMGMGKTIQCISMLLKRKERWMKDRAEMGEMVTDEDRPPPTLVVVPTSALVQWEQEIKDCVVEGSLRVFVYYANRKNVSESDIKGVDVVLTTYPVIEAEWRAIINRHMVACEWCGKKYLPRSMVTHLKYFCGPDAVRTEKLARREVTRETANEKAMRTLKIKSGNAEDVKASIPTPANFYKELMIKAGREMMSMYEGAHKARERAAAGLAPGAAGDTQAVVKEEVEEIEEKTELPNEMKTLIAGLPTPPSIKQEPENENVTEKDELTLAAEVALESAVRSMKKRMNNSKASTKKSKKSKKSLRDDSESEYEPEEGDDDDDDDDDDDGSVVFVEEVKPPSASKSTKKKKKTVKRENDDTDNDSKSVVTISSVENLSQGSQGEPAGEDDVDLSDSLLHRTHWHRIVLDEAHKIKARTSNTAKCIYALKSTFKWCLTGTPLQNRIGDLYSLVRFLRMDPYAYYFCSTKDCDCKTLSWNFGPEARFCAGCGCGAPRHYSYFNRAVMNPINRYGYVGAGKKAMLTLRNDILLPAQLRRTKAERANDVKLPELKIIIQENELNEVERDFYESLYMLTRAKFDGFVKKGSVLHNYAHIFELLARLRQACDHPYLVIHSKSANVQKDAPEAPKVDSPATADTPKYYCGMCQDEIEEEDAALASCKHIFHRECIMQYASCAPADGKKVTCPVCRTALTIDFTPDSFDGVKSAVNRFAKDPLPDKSILSKLDLTQYTSSTKVETLVNALRDMRNQENGHLNKAIVFSQYTAMIEIVEWRLKKAKFTIAKLLGSMPVTQRAANLQAFREDPNVSVILMSLKSGGEGLNLQAANYVFVLEPWWNPAVEMQAVMRAHRIGQHRPVTAVRFSTKGTIEERMMELQEKKQLVFEGCMDGNQASLSQLSAEDLQFLFKR